MLDALHHALRKGRHPCSCNSRRHALLCNCLACGKVICAQEGWGECLSCGCDPDLAHAANVDGKGGAGDAAQAMITRTLALALTVTLTVTLAVTLTLTLTLTLFLTVAGSLSGLDGLHHALRKS